MRNAFVTSWKIELDGSSELDDRSLPQEMPGSDGLNGTPRPVGTIARNRASGGSTRSSKAARRRRHSAPE